MNRNQRLSRRAVLRGLGTAIALPWLEGMGLARATNSTKGPLRTAFVYVPNGVHLPDWTPTTEGAGFELPLILRPLQKVKDQLLVLSGLALDPAQSHGDGGGDHARAMATFLTGRHPRKTNGTNLQAGISVDQVLAQARGSATRFASLEIGCEGGKSAGSCDHGYSCIYQTNLSWRSETTPATKEIDPRLLFERLFGSGDKTESAARRARQHQEQQSILDFVNEDARRLHSTLGSGDKRKMDEYLTAIREIEGRMNRAQPPLKVGAATLAKPFGVPKDYCDHVRLMSDLLVLAFQCDLSRIATFVYANDGSNRSYPLLGVPEGHHDISHHGGSTDKLAKISKINTFHVEQFAYLLEKLQAIPEGDGSLLDHCMIMYGSGISDGNTHNHTDLPILLAGKGCGTLATGRHLRYRENTPLTNLYLSLLDRFGVDVLRFGDSSGRLASLEQKS